MNLITSLISIILIYAISIINTTIEYIPDAETLKSLQAIFLSVGSALIGSTAIIFSIILFTLQVNNERVPYNVFKKFSTDKKLFTSFLFALVFSVFVAIFSFLSAKYTLYTIQASILLFVLILSCFIYSYRRALDLISPIFQLESIVKHAKYDLLKWSKEYENNKKNISKYEFFNSNPSWSDVVKQNIIYCNAYAKKLIEKNDYDTSKISLMSIVEINTAYVEVKNQAFARRRAFSDPLISNDKFIEDTLEEIRQNIQNGLAKNDERFISDNFKILKELHYIYSNIQYINTSGERFASSLASFYLIQGLEASISHNIPDVLLVGIRLLSEIAQKEIIDGESEIIGTILKIITDLTCRGIIDKKLEPITRETLEALAIITIQLLLSKEQNTNFITKDMNRFLYKIGKTEIISIDTSYSNFENIYYSKVSNELIDFTNSLMRQDFNESNQQQIIKIIKNIERWSDSIVWENRKLFELALEHNSNFVHQLIDFISNVSKCLMALSTLEIVDYDLSSKLKNNTLYLISIFTFIKEDCNTIMLLERANFINTIFKLTVDAYNYNLTNITLEVGNILLSVGFRGQKVDDQNRILAKALGGSIYINMLLNKNINDLLKIIKEKLNKYDLTDKNKQDAIRDLNNMLNIYPSLNLAIEDSLNSLEDREELKKYIDSISDLILNKQDITI